MNKPFLTEKRKDMLANYSLNISVGSFVVSVFEQTWWGFIPVLGGLVLFFFLTMEK